jgi:ribose/xylose/arabinose/galactoside ABC-type transport system permease subunit
VGVLRFVNIVLLARRGLVLLISVAAFLAMGSQVPHFLDLSNLLNVVRQSSIIGICAVGMTFVIVIKGIDLSLAGLLAFCPMIGGVLMLAGVAVPASLAVGILVGTIMGLFNGLMVSKLAVPAFITTLVVGEINQGLALTINGGSSIGAFPESFVFIGNGALAGVPVSDLMLLAFLALGYVIQSLTPLGNHIYALGGNEIVLRQEGLSAARLQLFVFGFSGFCAAVSGLLLSAQLDTVHPTQGDAYQLDAIAACIIGGVDLAGGRGSVPMAVVGALIIGCLRNALNLLGIHPFMQNVFVGSIIVVIVYLSGVARRHSELATRGTL